MSKVLMMLFALMVVTTCEAAVSNNFDITAGITQRGEKLELDGRINSGPRCGNLLIRCTVVSSQGQLSTIYASTSYSGSGGGLYGGMQRISVDRSRGLPTWKILQTTVACND